VNKNIPIVNFVTVCTTVPSFVDAYTSHILVLMKGIELGYCLRGYYVFLSGVSKHGSDEHRARS
jgi:hypothetical protein